MMMMRRRDWIGVTLTSILVRLLHRSSLVPISIRIRILVRSFRYGIGCRNKATHTECD